MTREEAKSCIGTIEMLQRLAYNIHGVMDVIDADNCKKIIKTLEQEPRKGHWIMSDDGLYRPICNKCGAHPWKGYIPTVEEATEVFKYCPNCGAKMVETQESEDKE